MLNSGVRGVLTLLKNGLTSKMKVQASPTDVVEGNVRRVVHRDEGCMEIVSVTVF